ncbi:hypothetical protein BC826DRAFT_1046930 [Russula brevipes]|nr:hypothetical protein BC826DRAFT_1046930 [Russula brevipes]
MAPFSCSKGIRKKVEELWKERIRVGFDHYLIDSVAKTPGLEKNALKSTLHTCGEDSEVEAFVEAIPYYLEIDQDADNSIGHKVSTRIHDIVSLLTPKGSELALGDRIAHLFVSCVKDHKKMDEMLRRRRAIACSHAVGEISKALLLVPGLKVTLPKSLRILLRRLCRDHDPKIVFAALNASTVFEHALSEQRAHAKGNKVQRQLHHLTGDGFSDRRLLALTDYMSSMLALIPRLDRPSHGDLEDTNMTIQKLCDGMKCRDYSPTAQKRFVEVLSDTWNAHLAAGSTGPHALTIQTHQGLPSHTRLSTSGSSSDLSQTLRSATETGYEPSIGHHSATETYHWHMILSTKFLVLTLDDEFAKSLHQRGFVFS